MLLPAPRPVVLLVLALVTPASGHAQETESLSVLDETASPAANKVVYEWFATEARTRLDQRREQFETLETPEACRAWQQRQRKFFVKQLGGFPERTPLNARVTGTLDGGEYRVEKVVYESRPHHHVTAALYLPKTPAPWPGVLIACGHTKSGKAAEYNQRMGIMLARNGVAALCYDPIGQGERSQVLTADGHPVHKSSTTEHFLVGVGSILTGTNTAQYRTWDGIRGIDYLCSRDDIDPARIGCTGCSGGGTLTSYIMALDDRVRCAAPACYLTTFRHLIDSIGPQDAEQDIFDQVRFGMDHPDYVLMRAPRPTLICCTTDDYFDVRGTWDTFRQAKRVYGLLGFAERVDLVEAPGGHGVKPLTREAMTRWMRRWLLDKDDAVTDQDFEVWTEEQLRCTPAGEVLQLPDERSVYDLNAERALALRQARPDFRKLSADQVRRIIQQAAGIRSVSDIPRAEARVVGTVQRDGYRIRKLIIEAEKGLPLPALLFVPAQATNRPVLYLHGGGKRTEALPGGQIEGLVRDGSSVLAVDLPGIGETRGDRASDLLGDWKNHFMAYLLGRSLVAVRAESALACARWLQTGAQDAATIDLWATGEAVIPAKHAQALAPTFFTDSTFVDGLESWESIVGRPDAENQLTGTIHGVLGHYDLPDLSRARSDGPKGPTR